MSKTAPHIIRAREAHHEALAQLAGIPIRDGLNLWRKLRRIEREAEAIGLQLCNGPEMLPGEQERRVHAIYIEVDKALGGKTPKGFFVNLDPRGYSLKLKPGTVPLALHEDWGRYQILAPEID